MHIAAAGRAEARRRRLRVTGTLGVLRAGAEQGVVNVPDLIERLKSTTFYPDANYYNLLIIALLERGAPMTLEEAAASFAAAGVASKPLRARAATALTRCPRTAARQIGLLRVLVGDVSRAGAVLAKSPGLGWSNPDHPGHMLLPLLVTPRLSEARASSSLNAWRRQYCWRSSSAQLPA
jgi:hypothetical protein